ncbi:hypothetical protein BV22DRAFT_824577 [Leucogyrophana mollusca]|uniref:Uncharacterized protein n=1 Tax=Leucogyrophana mollusca TaxID=85980 RepID=A0ACB8B3H4_9AGAM|nr:hypothetical protein BV22DRAFT_824577 [Leucogyrophana mollusca]
MLGSWRALLSCGLKAVISTIITDAVSLSHRFCCSDVARTHPAGTDRPGAMCSRRRTSILWYLWSHWKFGQHRLVQSSSNNNESGL